MWLRVGCELLFDLEISTPFILMLRPRSGSEQWLARDEFKITPNVQVVEFTDDFGNLCQQLTAPKGNFSIQTKADVKTSEHVDVGFGACFVEIQSLPHNVLSYLLPSRYCESDRFNDLASQITVNQLPGYNQVAAIGVSPVNYWMHANMLELNGQRMSKSTGNTVNPDELLSGNNTFFSKAYSPSVIRFFNAQASYRSVLDLTDEGLLASEKGYYRLMDAVNLLDDLKASPTSSIDIKAWKQKCYDAMNDDFNSPILIAHLFEAAKYINQIKEGSETLNTEDLELLKTTLNNFVYDVLGLENTTKSDSGTDKLSGAVDVLIRLRQDARANKDFALSDKIRDELAEVGIQLKDGKDGTTFSVN